MVRPIARRQRIADLIAAHQVTSQEQLQDMLARQRITVTQATLSRDLRDMGVLKGPGGYRLPSTDGAPPASAQRTGGGAATINTRELERALPGVITSADAGGQLVVLHTQPAHANPLAIEIDRAHLPEVLGTIAGDDTVFVATRSERDARKLLRMIQRMAGWEAP